MKHLTGLLAALTLAATGCGGDQEPALSTGQLEQKIKAEFQKGAAGRDTADVTIQGVDCVRKSDAQALCTVNAEERDNMGLYGPSSLDLDVTIDPDTGEYKWRESDS
jgi:hypothetical protein